MKQKKSKQNNENAVTFLSDPFSLPHLDLMDAQASADELVLDAELDNQALEQLDRVARAIETQVEKDQKELEAAVESASAESPDDLLARQIEEDLALESEAAADDALETDGAADAPPQAELDLIEIQAQLETLLFLSDRPLPLKRLKELLGPGASQENIESALVEMQARYQAAAHGFELVEVGGGFQFRTKTRLSPVARRLVKVQAQRLSRGAMETLAIVAYKQPTFKENIDKIRGVDSSHFIRGLLEKRLIQISGRSELPGRPMLYSTTQEFLELFGLRDLSSLPPLQEIEKMIPTSEVAASDEENPALKEMRRLIHQISEDKDRIDYDPREDEKILKDIRERIKAVPVTTPFLQAQDEAAKQAEAAPEEPGAAPDAPTNETPAV